MNLLNQWRLHSKDPHTRQMAVERLAASRGSRAVELLLLSLHDEDAQVRRSGARAFGGIRDPRAVESLILALKDLNPEVRAAAAYALGRQGDSSSIEHLVRVLDDSQASVSISAATSLTKMGWKPATDGELAVFEAAMGNRRPVAFTSDIVGESRVVEFTHKDVSQPLVPHSPVTTAAPQDHCELRAIQPLLAVMQGSDHTAKVSAVYALGDQPGDLPTEVLLRSLRDPDPCVRLAAGDVLARRENPAYKKLFIALLSDSHFEVRLKAIGFLGKLRDPNLCEHFLPLMSDLDSDVRQAAIRVLGATGSSALIETLVPALIDEEGAVRETALSVLSGIDANWAASEPAQRAAARLEASLKDRHPWVRTAAAPIIARIKGKSTDDLSPWNANVLPVE